ncbi:tRNA 5-methylaminomethyl-2-thiouridine biosynthesis bifunctional protein MnmC, partial [Bienertia sinuspersici]
TKRRSPPSSSQFNFSWLSQPQQDLCFKLRKRRVKPTLRYSPHDAKELGVDDCLQQLAQKHGFSKVLNLKEDVYLALVLEFLSTLEVFSKKGDISFSTGGMKWHMSLRKVNELFEFPLEGTIGPESFKYFCEDANHKSFVAKHFWKEVTGRSDWLVGFTKSFAFVNLAIRFLHRFLLQVFYLKGETGQVATNDFLMLWWFVHGDPDKMGQLDFG